MWAKTKQTRPKTRIRMEPRLSRIPGFHHGNTTSSRVSNTPGGDFSTARSRAGAVVAKLRDLDFQESEDWWGLLSAVSRECGFSLTRIEERCER